MTVKGMALGLVLLLGENVMGVPTSSIPSVQRFCPQCATEESAASRSDPTGTVQQPAGLSVTIPPHASLFAISEQLVQAGILRSKWAFALKALFKGAGRKLKAGTYCFLPGASTDDVLRALIQGATVVHKVLIPEGLTVSAIITLVQQHPCLSGEITARPSEGHLLPGTYYVYKDKPRQTVLRDMEAAQQKLLSDIAPSFALGEEGLRILASIVEKETHVPNERGRVAGVFLLRLQKGMPLQADPTVIYGLTLGQKPLGRSLTRADWKIDSPYNTYRYKGLPPGPICCPGEATLRATAKAIPGTDLFFVADGRGGHRFSATLAEHNRNVEMMRQTSQKK